MCGIVGAVQDRENLAAMRQAIAAMHHRGPDAEGLATHHIGQSTILLGHRRLSILDLSTAADQPLISECGRYVLIYNGEIYNHAALRAELSERGDSFNTHSDTEVLLKGLIRHGPDFIGRLNGMFAFAMLDKADGMITLARDPFGIKPLYILETPDGICFASELRSLQLAAGTRLEPDPDCFAEFFLNGFLYEPRSGLKGVRKIAPGTVETIAVDPPRTMTTKAYALAPREKTVAPGDLASLLSRQIGLEMLADVRVGVFFSGGIDSAALVAAAPQPVEAFFVDYGPEAGDAGYAQAVAKALGTPLRNVSQQDDSLTPEGIFDEFRAVACGTEEPISDFTFAATRALSRQAREAGFKVMLSGMGGDELYAGYPRHLAARHWTALRLLEPPLRMARPLLRRSPRWDKKADRLQAFLAARDFVEAYTALVGYFSADEVSRLVGSRADVDSALDRVRAIIDPVRNASPLRQALYLDRHGYLAHNLTVTDRASMAESIEVRVPLLNTALEAHSWSLPDGSLVSGKKGKIPLRQFLRDRLPADVLNRPKVGFNPPLDGRVRMLGRERIQEQLSGRAMQGALDTAGLASLVDEHFEGRANHTYRLWQLLYFSFWLESWGEPAHQPMS